MQNKKIDTMAKLAMRSRGLSVKEKRVRFQGKMVTFKYETGHYAVFCEGEKIDSFPTDNINQAIADYKEKHNKNNNC